MPLAPYGESTALTALLTGRYISLHTGSPVSGGGNEVAGGDYARQAAGTFTQSGSNPTSAVNDNSVAFPVATGNWGNITHFGVWTAAVGGDLIAYNTVAVAKTIGTGDIARWPAGSLEVTAD
jgi:hypothetical protein